MQCTPSWRRCRISLYQITRANRVIASVSRRNFIMTDSTNSGIPVYAEYLEELDDLYVRLCHRIGQNEVLTPEELAIIDVYSAIGFIECRGLHQFWAMDDDTSRIIRAFRKVGAGLVADRIEDSSWAAQVVARGMDRNGNFRYTSDEDARLSMAERVIYESFKGLPIDVLNFARSHGIGG